MKPAITFNGKPIQYEAVTYGKGQAFEMVIGELVEVDADTSPLDFKELNKGLTEAGTELIPKTSNGIWEIKK